MLIVKHFRLPQPPRFVGQFNLLWMFDYFQTGVSGISTYETERAG
jgi:hypothetical protein